LLGQSLVFVRTSNCIVVVSAERSVEAIAYLSSFHARGNAGASVRAHVRENLDLTPSRGPVDFCNSTLAGISERSFARQDRGTGAMRIVWAAEPMPLEDLQYVGHQLIVPEWVL
jgi:hypothetical protein